MIWFSQVSVPWHLHCRADQGKTLLSSSSFLFFLLAILGARVPLQSAASSSPLVHKVLELLKDLKPMQYSQNPLGL